jgi:hypothetical protein
MTRRIPICQCLANLKAFCQTLAKCIPRAANGFANVWQNSPVFAEHWQIPNWGVRLPAAQLVLLRVSKRGKMPHLPLRARMAHLPITPKRFFPLSSPSKERP